MTINERFSTAGRIGSRVRKNNTIRSIEKAIDVLVQEQKKITKKLVASVAKRTEKIVARHWNHFEEKIKTLNNEHMKFLKKMKGLSQFKQSPNSDG